VIEAKEHRINKDRGIIPLLVSGRQGLGLRRGKGFDWVLVMVFSFTPFQKIDSTS
jgi:hypothetical protein